MLRAQFWNVKFEMLTGHSDGEVKKVGYTAYISLEFGEKLNWR